MTWTRSPDPLRRALRLALFLFIFGIAGLAFTAPAAATSLQDSAATEEPAKSAVLHTSPRAVVEAFLSGMKRYHALKTNEDAALRRVLSCFDLGDQQRGAEELETLAVEFYESLNRLTFIDLADVGDSDERALHTWRVQADDLSFTAVVTFVRIEAARDGRPPNWRFAPAVLDEIPGWYDVLRDRPIVTDVAIEIEDAKTNLALLERLGFWLEEHLPEALLQQTFLLEQWQWLGLLALVLLGTVLGRIANLLCRALSSRLGRSERIEVEPSVLTGFERPFGLWVMAWIILLMLPALHLEPRFFRMLRLAVVFFLAVTGVWSAYRLVDVGASMLAAKASKTANRFDDMLVPLVRRTAKIFLTFVGIIYVASFLSEDLYGIVAGLSIGSLAVGFAAKDSIENLFGTVTVLLDKPYQLGDWITVGDIDGTVEEVGFRSTKIRTFYNSVISVPNSRFISAHIDNWGARRYRRIKTTVGLAYDTKPLDIEAFCEGVRELIRKHPYTRKDYYHIYLSNLGASSLDVLVYCFVETPDWSTELREKHRLFLDILRVADGLGVEIAFPTQTLHVHTDADAGGEPPVTEPPADSRGAQRMGRELADLVVKEGLAGYEGRKPPPVVID
jgi:MscS family membrane protein